VYCSPVENLRIEIPTRRATLVAVDDVSFEVAAGEVLGVVGETGAGKSLTGTAIIGLLDPPARIAGGRISLADGASTNLPAEAMRSLRGKDIGAVFQDPLTSLNPLLTVGRHLTQTILTASRHVPGQSAGSCSEAVDRGGHSRGPRAPRQLSASTVGRHAAAGRACTRLCLRAEAHHRR
jgi:peptide/nickel transport system ATP-binding protein